MQNQPPNPQQYPPHYTPTSTQPVPPTYPPYPPYSQPLPSAYPPAYPPAPYQPQPQSQDNATALVLEAVCSIFGLYGIGWLYRGRVGTGVALLVAGFAWVAFAFVAALFTFGFALLCIGPLHLLFIVGDVLMLNNALRQPWQR